MKERTLDAICKAEEYFVKVIEDEADGDVVPSRTEELHYALEALEGIAVIKYKQMCKQAHKEGRVSLHDTRVLKN